MGFYVEISNGFDKSQVIEMNDIDTCIETRFLKIIENNFNDFDWVFCRDMKKEKPFQVFDCDDNGIWLREMKDHEGETYFKKYHYSNIKLWIPEKDETVWYNSADIASKMCQISHAGIASFVKRVSLGYRLKNQNGSEFTVSTIEPFDGKTTAWF